MNINLKFLLIGTSLSLIPTITNAQCVATTDCASLGYTETSCPDGKGLKCPFGNTFACPSSEASVCEKYGFKYDCKGTEYASGVGNACNNKYASCTCAQGYERNNGECKEVLFGTCTGRAKKCKVGQILNADGSCSDYRVDGVTPIGIVAYISPEGCGYALGIISYGNTVYWGKMNDDIPELTNYKNAPVDDLDGCKTAEIVRNYSYKVYGDYAKSNYKYFWDVLNRVSDNVPTTKGKWCFPSAGIVKHIYDNKEIINETGVRIGRLGFVYNFGWWVTSEFDAQKAWVFNMNSGTFTTDLKGNYNQWSLVIKF